MEKNKLYKRTINRIEYREEINNLFQQIHCKYKYLINTKREANDKTGNRIRVICKRNIRIS